MDYSGNILYGLHSQKLPQKEVVSVQQHLDVARFWCITVAGLLQAEPLTFFAGALGNCNFLLVYLSEEKKELADRREETIKRNKDNLTWCITRRVV